MPENNYDVVFVKLAEAEQGDAAELARASAELREDVDAIAELRRLSLDSADEPATFSST